MENEDQIEEQINEPLNLRDTISASMDAHAPQNELEQEPTSRARDEQGRFAPKEKEQAEEAPLVVETPTPVQEPMAAPPQELTTWRREMRPLQAKLASGQPLTADESKQLAEYNIQREREYSTGISTYKGEAAHAKEITGVIQEFMPALQQAGIAPAAWIQNMGRTHAALVFGAPEQKLHIFGELAKSYGVPLDALIQYAQGGGVNPMHAQAMQQQSQMQQEIQSVKQWMQQQQEQAVHSELSKFRDANRFPHFEQVRDKMAQILEAGLANDPEEAYSAAVRMDANVWSAEQQRQAAANAEQQKQVAQAAAKKARIAGASVRSGTPAAAALRPATDLHGTLADAFDQVVGSGRV